MINKYNNPRLFNTVLTGPGMEHPRNPHVVIGSDTKGFIQGDLMDANAIMETIDQKINADNLIDLEKLTNAVNSIIGGASTAYDTLGELATGLSNLSNSATKRAFSDIKVGSSTVASDSKNDVLEFVGGNNIDLTPDVDGDKVTFSLNPNLYERPEEGDFLYSDYTWGKSSSGAIGICVNSGESFLDNCARFIPYQTIDTTFKRAFSTENVWLNTSGTDGVYNTDLMISKGAGLYPAAEFCRTFFNGNGYLPSTGELVTCLDAMKKLDIIPSPCNAWSSCQWYREDYYGSDTDKRAWNIRVKPTINPNWESKSMPWYSIPFVKVEPKVKTLVRIDVTDTTLNILSYDS